MPYATQQHLIDRFGGDELAQLTDRVNGSVIDAAVVARALSDADAEIDGYLAVRFALPLPRVPAVLVRIACDMARFRLYDSVPDSIRKRYEDAVRDLKGYASGSLALDGVAPLLPAATSVAVKVQAPDRLFGTDTLARY